MMASEARVYAEDNAFHTQEPPKQATYQNDKSHLMPWPHDTLPPPFL